MEDIEEQLIETQYLQTSMMPIFERFKRLNKDISKAVRKDLRRYNIKVTTRVKEESQRLKFLKQKIAYGRKNNCKMTQLTIGCSNFHVT